MKNSSRFFCNRECEYFPCHTGIAQEEFNCLFCYCPLYFMGDKCGGNFLITGSGIKSCVNCTRPHIPENYDTIMHTIVENYNKSKGNSNEDISI